MSSDNIIHFQAVLHNSVSIWSCTASVGSFLAVAGLILRRIQLKAGSSLFLFATFTKLHGVFGLPQFTKAKGSCL